MRRTYTKILYFSPQSSTAPKAVLFTGQGNDVVTASSVAEALAIMRRQMFDALVVDCAEDTLDLLNFTAKAQSLQPSLAVFLAGDRGDELVTGLQEFGGVMTMLQNDECASLVVSGWIP